MTRTDRRAPRADRRGATPAPCARRPRRPRARSRRPRATGPRTPRRPSVPVEPDEEAPIRRAVAAVEPVHVAQLEIDGERARAQHLDSTGEQDAERALAAAVVGIARVIRRRELDVRV